MLFINFFAGIECACIMLCSDVLGFIVDVDVCSGSASLFYITFCVLVNELNKFAQSN